MTCVQVILEILMIVFAFSFGKGLEKVASIEGGLTDPRVHFLVWLCGVALMVCATVAVFYPIILFSTKGN